MSLAARVRWTPTATWIALCAINSALVYLLIFLLPFQLTQYYAVPLPNFYSFQNASPALLGVGWIILFQLYYIGYRLCPARPSRAIMTLLVAFPIFFSLILLFMYPIGANDLFDMVFRGHILGQLGKSPFSTVPNMFQGDPFLKYVWWKDISGAYGPVWEGLAALVTRLVGSGLLVNLFSYKLLAVAHFWAGMPLVYFTLRRFRPEFAVAGLFLYSWNPLAQFEIAGNGHSEGMVLFWLVAAVCLLIRGRHLLALLALTVAVLVKFIPILLVPLFLVALWKAHADKALISRLRQIVIAVASMGALAIAIYIPFGIGSVITNISYLNSRDYLYHSSVPLIALRVLQDLGVPGPMTPQIVRPAATLLMGIAVLWQVVRLLRGSADPYQVKEGVIRGSFEILFLYLLAASLWFQPWYLLWLLAFVPFLPRFGYLERTALFCFTSLASYFIWFYRWPIGSPDGEVAERMLFWVIFPAPFLLSIGLWLYYQRVSFISWLRVARGSSWKLRRV